MKKAKKTISRKSNRRVPKRSSSNQHIILFRRVFLITSALVLFLFVSADVSKRGVTQAVAGISVARGLFNQATVSLPNVEGVVTYNIYYKRTSDSEFGYAVRNISGDLSSYTISYLKKGEEYEYKVSAADKTGKEFFFTESQALSNLESM